MRAVRPFLSILLLSSFLPIVGRPATRPDAADRYRETYFAPVMSFGLWRMRMEDGAIREFETGRDSSKLRSVDGWTAKVKGQDVTVSTPAGEKPAKRYSFSNGTLTEVKVGKRVLKPAAGGPVVYEDETVWPLLPEEDEINPDDLPVGTWERESRRLRLWFDSPNQAGTFISFLLILFISLAFRLRNRAFKVVCVLLSAGGLVALLWTDSRGAWVATGAALLIVVLCHLRAKGVLTRRRAVLALCAFATVLLAVGVVSLASGRDSRRDYRRSDEARVTVWRTVPRMIHDAPFGWGPRLRDVGMAYTKWYAQKAPTRVWYTLVNDHLTILAAGGWIGSGLYLMLWFGGVFLLFAFAWRGGSPVPAALWTSLGVSSFFNVVLLVPLLQILAFASLAVLAFDRRWLSRRCWLAPVGAGALCTVATLVVIGWLGGGFRSAPSLRAAGKSVRVNGDDPRVWVVDDGEVLGSVATAWEIRQFYRFRPTAAAIGYLMKLDDVRDCPGVRRLVLAGKRAEEFVRRFAAGDRTLRIPSEVVFIAPPFAPSAVPVELMARTRVAFVYGEFHARYFPELAQPRQGVAVVKGAEQYIPAWMRFCVD